MTLAGLTNVNTINSAFKITVAAQISTQVLFALTIKRTSQFSQMSFFVVMLSNDSATYVEAFFVCTLQPMQPKVQSASPPPVRRSTAHLSTTPPP